MFGKFLPKDNNFFNLFDQHAAIIIQATQEFQELVSSNNLINFRDAQKFREWEHHADNIVHECVEALHKTFITPIDREDILRLISGMDDIIDCVDNAADCLVIYKIEKTTEELKKMSQILFRAVDKMALAVQGIRNLNNVEIIKVNCRLVRNLESEGDIVVRNAIGKLFDEEHDTRFLIKLKEIYEILEDAIDHCHKVVNIVEGIILEYV